MIGFGADEYMHRSWFKISEAKYLLTNVLILEWEGMKGLEIVCAMFAPDHFHCCTTEDWDVPVASLAYAEPVHPLTSEASPGYVLVAVTATTIGKNARVLLVRIRACFGGPLRAARVTAAGHQHYCIASAGPMSV